MTVPGAGGIVATFTVSNDVLLPEATAEVVRAALLPELARLDVAVSTRSTLADVMLTQATPDTYGGSVQ